MNMKTRNNNQKCRLGRLFIAVVACLITGLSGSLTSCVKVWEEERVEVIHPPKVDMKPDAPDWDDPTTITNGDN